MTPTNSPVSCRSTTAHPMTCAKWCAHCRRVRFQRFQTAIWRFHRLHSGRHPRHRLRHHWQQRPDRSRRRHQGRAVHPALRSGRSAADFPQQHHRLHGRHRYEQAGMIKHGAKMIQAVSNASVPQHHALYRRQLRRRQLRHVRLCLRAGLPVLLAQCDDRRDGRRAGGRHHDAGGALRWPPARAPRWTRSRWQSSGARSPHISTGSRMRFTRRAAARSRHHRSARHSTVLGFCLETCLEARSRPLQPNSFGVARL